jgi:hypothetical protein
MDLKMSCKIIMHFLFQPKQTQNKEMGAKNQSFITTLPGVNNATMSKLTKWCLCKGQVLKLKSWVNSLKSWVNSDIRE